MAVGRHRGVAGGGLSELECIRRRPPLVHAFRWAAFEDVSVLFVVLVVLSHLLESSNHRTGHGILRTGSTHGIQENDAAKAEQVQGVPRLPNHSRTLTIERNAKRAAEGLAPPEKSPTIARGPRARCWASSATRATWATASTPTSRTGAP